MSEFFGEAVKAEYFENIEGVESFHIARWFEAVCASDQVQPHELEAFDTFLTSNIPLDQIKDIEEYLGRLSEMEPQSQKLALINNAIACIVSSPYNTVDEKVSYLSSFSASLYNAARPLNGKSMVMRHVNRHHAAALSADVFHNGFSDTYKQADELQWRARTEIPRLKSRSQILSEYFEHMTGEMAPRFILAFIAVDAAMVSQDRAAKAAARNERRDELTHERHIRKIARLMRKHPDDAPYAFLKAYWGTNYDEIADLKRLEVRGSQD